MSGCFFLKHGVQSEVCVRNKMHAFAYFQRNLLLIYRLSFALPLLSLFWCLAGGIYARVHCIL